MPSNEETLEENFEDEEEDDDEEEEDLISYSPSTSSDDPNKYSNTLAAVPISASGGAAFAVPNGIVTVPISVSLPRQQQQPLPPPPQQQPQPQPQQVISKPSLFQRLWTDSDEIGLLQGFLDYTTQRGGSQNSSYHLDTALFYDQIKSRLQLDFNKNQLVEKLRRLKKKYRNAVNRMSNGKDFSFKSPHDRLTFEISDKIWGSVGIGGSGNAPATPVTNPNVTTVTAIAATPLARVEVVRMDEEEQKPKVIEKIENNNGGVSDVGFGGNDSKVCFSAPKQQKKRPREENSFPNLPTFENSSNSSVSTVIEDTVKSCLSPLFKELFHHAINGGSGNLGGLGGLGLNSLPLGVGVGAGASSSGEKMDEKWRKQQILELEVYSKRVELVQEEIKEKLEELKANDS